MTLDGKSVCITGGCGFLGRHLVRQMLANPVQRLVIIDNLSVGSKECLPLDPRVQLMVGDVRNQEIMEKALAGIDVVFHFAAPTDVRKALQDPRFDLEHGVLGTATVLECARQANANKIVFASSSCVYGSGLTLPVGEDAGPLLPSSVYGASKLAAEGLISAYCNSFNMQSWIFRFPNVVGAGLTHGVVLDFMNKLKATPTSLQVFGDGTQTKTYLWASDCIEGVLSLVQTMSKRVNVANVTTRGFTSVKEIAQIVAQEMGLQDVPICYSGGDRGWPGDVPSIRLDDSTARGNGWAATYESSEAIRMTIRSLLEQH